MLIQKVQVKNFRSILTNHFPVIPSLRGWDGRLGKSSFLSAIELFYNPSAKITEETFTMRTLPRI